MRIIEVAITVLGILWMFLEINRKKSNRPIFLPGIVFLVGLLGVHYFIEGIRWQMSLAYLIIFVGLFIGIIQLISSKDERILRHKRRYGKKRIGINLLVIVLFCFNLLLLILFPINKMSEPSGPLQVGTMVYDLIDGDRMEIYGSRLNQDNRKIRIQIWYPTDDVSDGELTPWLYDGPSVVRMVAKVAKMPFFVLEHTALVDSNSYENVPLSQSKEQYPVVLMSHGWTGYRQLHADMGEMLASHGYIAIGIDHTYGALTTVFEDGTEVKVDYRALPDRGSVDNFDFYANQLVNTFALDGRLILNHLETLSGSGFFENRIDLAKIGALGHSTGGGAMVELALIDERIKGVFGLDPWVEPISEERLNEGLSIPSLFLRSEEWENGINNQYLKQLNQHSLVPLNVYQIVGSNHQDLTMLYMFEPMYRILGFSGSLDSSINNEIQKEHILSFFEMSLKGKEHSSNPSEEVYGPVYRVDFSD